MNEAHAAVLRSLERTVLVYDSKIKIIVENLDALQRREPVRQQNLVTCTLPWETIAKLSNIRMSFSPPSRCSIYARKIGFLTKQLQIERHTLGVTILGD